MLRIETAQTTPTRIRYALVGRLCPECVGEVEKLLDGAAREGLATTLDLAEIETVARESLPLLAGWRRRGVTLANVPPYVSSWLAAEEKAPGPLARLAILPLLLVAASALGEPVRLSRSDAVRLALSQGTAARIAAERVEESRAVADHARAALMPQVRLGLTQSNQSLDSESFGFTIPGTRILGPFSYSDGRITAALAVVDLAARARWNAAKAGIAVTEAAREKAENDVAAAVSSLYAALLDAEAQVKTRESTVALFEKLRDLAEDQRRAGVGTRLDTTRALVQLSREKQGLAAAREQRDVARLALLHAAGLDQGSEVVLTDALVVPAESPGVPEALDEARARRPELRLAGEKAAAADLFARAARAERLPVLGLTAQGGYGGNQLNDLAWTRAVGAGVTVPLFTGGALKARIAEADVKRREVETEKIEALRQVEEEVRRALVSLETARSRVELAEENLRLSTEELEVAEDRFRNGVAASIEVDNAQTSYSAASEARVAAIARASQAGIDLARATGRIRDLVPRDEAAASAEAAK
ncbi:MAG: TolC family protein [Thermoanaerobaculia bacterium]